MTEFVIIRHGETVENLAGIIQGHYDSSLNEVGMQQAEAVAERLKNEPFDVFYSSDLRRAVHTAEAIARKNGMAFETLPELREWHLGVLEKQSADRMRELYPAVMDAFKHAPLQDVAVPEGESHSAFHNRICQVMEELASRHAGKRILLVTHGGVLREIFRLTAGVPLPRNAQPLLTNTGYTRVRKNDLGEWQLCVWNDSSHLSEAREQKAF
jgi:probable phosphoglycerate mutase